MLAPSRLSPLLNLLSAEAAGIMLASPVFGKEHVYKDVSSAVWCACRLQRVVPVGCQQKCGFVLGHSPAPQGPSPSADLCPSPEGQQPLLGCGVTSGLWLWGDRTLVACLRFRNTPSCSRPEREPRGRPLISPRLMAEGGRGCLAWRPRGRPMPVRPRWRATPSSVPRSVRSRAHCFRAANV